MPSKKTLICLRKMDNGTITQTWLTSKLNISFRKNIFLTFFPFLNYWNLHYFIFQNIASETNHSTQQTLKELLDLSDLIMDFKCHHLSQLWTTLKVPIMIIIWWPEKGLSIKLVHEQILNKLESKVRYHPNMVMLQKVNWFIKEVWTLGLKNLLQVP